MAAVALSAAPTTTPVAGQPSLMSNVQSSINCPSGPCYFRILSAGRDTPRCGCRRFWNIKHSQPVRSNQGGWEDERPYECACGHHACFHDDGPDGISKTANPTTVFTQTSHRRPNSSENLPFLSNGNEIQTSADPFESNPSSTVPRRDAEGVALRSHNDGSQSSIAARSGAQFVRNGSYPRSDSLPSTRTPIDVPPVPQVSSNVLDSFGSSGLPPIPSLCRIDPMFLDPNVIASEGVSIGVNGVGISTGDVHRGVSNMPSRSGSANFNRFGSQRYDNMELQSYHHPDRSFPVSVIGPISGELGGRDETPTEVATPVEQAIRQRADGLDTSLQGLGDWINIHTHQTPLEGSFHGNNDLGDTHKSTGNLDIANMDNGSDAGAIRQLIPMLQSVMSHINTYPTVATALQAHANRLEVLENASFVQGPLEELQDKTELLEGRVTEVEGKIDEHDKHLMALDDGSMNGQGVHLGTTARTRLNGSFMSDASNRTTSTALIANVTSRAELESRIQKLEARIQELGSVTAPSKDRPWEIEVVVIPWGRHLRGIWYQADDFPTSRSTTQASEEWTGDTDQAEISLISGSRDDGGAWDRAAIQRWADNTHSWMAARACAPSSKVYSRLKSRGFVRDVQITDNCAASVQKAILATFEDILSILVSGDSMLESESQGSFRSSSHLKDHLPLGLKEPFIPFRKVYKQSRLQFLTPAEMVTSALWTCDFLRSDVVMRANDGRKRLFITHRDAYLQRGECTEWTWQSLKQLPRYDRGFTESALPGTMEAMESCWIRDIRLDPSASLQSSFASVGTRPSYSSFKEREQPGLQLPKSGRTSHLSSRSPEEDAAPASPISELPDQRHRRTASMPSIPALSTSNSALSAKRRLLQLNDTRPASQSTSKRPRLSRSPTFEPSIRFAATPRRSDPPSPFFSEIVGQEGRSQLGPAVATLKRATTPFAYATPHSGPIENNGDNIREGGTSDSEPIRDVVTEGVEEEAWEGVGSDKSDDSDSEEGQENDEELSAGEVDDESGHDGDYESNYEL